MTKDDVARLKAMVQECHSLADELASGSAGPMPASRGLARTGIRTNLRLADSYLLEAIEHISLSEGLCE